MAKGGKSTLDGNHRFPAFYACYLLKSIRTPKSTATYIGSTPNPPRRIRQHNGELTAGAWKTSRNRPWVMQMIVHGFPSKLSALQFEWAWQHPHASRHLKDPEDSTKPLFAYKGSQRPLKGNIAIVRKMLSVHPYTLWPLHVKLFSRDAVKHWHDAGNFDAKLRSKPPPTLGMPTGFTVSVELEGVDGKTGASEDVESGRGKPIEVTDATFTSMHLAKHTKLLSQGHAHRCVVCAGTMDVASSDHLSLSLCPTDSCTAVAHLVCLARHFLRSDGTAGLIPRGGSCPSCKEYILWGDVVRSCYRRSVGRQGVEEQAEQEEEAEITDDEEVSVSRTPKRAKTSAKGKATATRKRRAENHEEESERETFDLDAVSGSESESDEAPATVKAKVGPSKPQKNLKSTPSTSTALRKRKQVKIGEQLSDEGELFDLNAINSDDESDPSPPRKKSGLSRSVLPLAEVARRTKPSPRSRLVRELSSLSISSPPTSPRQDVIILSD